MYFVYKYLAIHLRLYVDLRLCSLKPSSHTFGTHHSFASPDSETLSSPPRPNATFLRSNDARNSDGYGVDTVAGHYWHHQWKIRLY